MLPLVEVIWRLTLTGLELLQAGPGLGDSVHSSMVLEFVKEQEEARPGEFAAFVSAKFASGNTTLSSNLRM